MNRDLRILLLDESRYHTLLMERELSRACPDAVVATFHSARAAIEELLRAHYHVAVIDGSLSEIPSDDVIGAIRRFDHQMQMLVLTDPRKPQAQAAEERTVFLKKDEHYFAALPRIIREFLTHSQSSSSTAWPQTANSLESEPARSIVGLLAHEINNPLMIIQGVAELLAEHEQTDPTVKTKIELIRRAARRIEQVMGQLQKGGNPAHLSSATTEPSVAPHLTRTEPRRIEAACFHNSD